MSAERPWSSELTARVWHRAVPWRAFLADLSGFGIVRIASIVYPLLVLPIMAHAFTSSGLGTILLFTNLATWLAILITYGFEATGTRALILTQEHQRAEEARTVWAAQLIVSAVLFIIMLAGYFVVPFMHDHAGMTGLSWMSAVAQGIHARWYFRATQQIKRMALIEVGPKFASLPFIAAAVWIWPQPFPAYFVMLLAHMVTAFLSVRIALREVGPIRLSIEDTAARLIKDFPVFLSFAGASLYSAANVVILGLFLPVSSVGFFGAAERMVRVVASIVAIVPQSFFPIMIKMFLNDLGRARHLVWISSGILLVVGILCAMTLYFLSPILVQIMLGAKYNEVEGLLRSLTAVLPFLATANVFGTLGLLASGRNGVYAVVTLGAGIINVIFAVILVPIFAEQGMVFAVLGSALILALGYGTAFYFWTPAKEAGR